MIIENKFKIITEEGYKTYLIIDGDNVIDVSWSDFCTSEIDRILPIIKELKRKIKPFNKQIIEVKQKIAECRKKCDETTIKEVNFSYSNDKNTVNPFTATMNLLTREVIRLKEEIEEIKEKKKPYEESLRDKRRDLEILLDNKRS